MRQILHVDMDAFFAAIEQKRNPDLAGKPVVIGSRGDPRERGVVSTASYEARNYGVHSAMPLRAALRLCPQAVFLAVDYEEYARISAIIKTILREFTPLVEDAGLDEAYLDITGLEAAPEEVAGKIKQRIRERTGLSCSIGIAPNKLLAKICSDLDKPDGLTALTEAELKNRIWPLPVRSLPGIGPITAERLVPMGVTTIRQLACLPLADLVKEFGPAQGELLYLSSRGIDRRPVVTHREPKSHSRERTFQVDIGDPEVLASVIATLAREVSDDLRKDGYGGRTVAVKVRFSNFETHTREKTLDQATDSSELIRQAALDCLRRVALNKKVRLIGIRVGGIERSRFQ
ncbi:MAG: DNA polymerase IV [Gammaproteobacteria bacterium]